MLEVETRFSLVCSHDLFDMQIAIFMWRSLINKYRVALFHRRRYLFRIFMKIVWNFLDFSCIRSMWKFIKKFEEILKLVSAVFHDSARISFL